MTDKDNGGPAYPAPAQPKTDWRLEDVTSGMSLRDYFAGRALEGVSSTNPHLPGSAASPSFWPEPEELARRRAVWAYLQADAMLEARK